MAFQISCPSCGTKLKVPSKLASSGQCVKCPQCSSVIAMQAQAAPIPSAPSGPRWYAARNGKRQGPFTYPQIQQLARTGKLRPTDMLWQEGQQTWIPASSVQGLFATPEPCSTSAPPATGQGDDGKLDSANADAERLEQMADQMVRRAEESRQRVRSLGFLADYTNVRSQSQKLLVTYDALLRMFPDSWKVWYARGLTLAYTLGEIDRGLADLHQALSLSPTSDRIQQSIEELRQASQPTARAGEGVEALLAGDLDHSHDVLVSQAEQIAQVDAMFGTSADPSQRGHLTNALQEVGLLIRVNPNCWQLWYVRGIYLASLGDNDAAAKSLQKALSLSPDERRIQRAIDALEQGIRRADQARERQNTWQNVNKVAMTITLVMLGVMLICLLLCVGFLWVGPSGSAKPSGSGDTASSAAQEQEAKLRALKTRLENLRDDLRSTEGWLDGALRQKAVDGDPKPVQLWVSRLDLLSTEAESLQRELGNIKKEIGKLDKRSTGWQAGDAGAISNLDRTLGQLSSELVTFRDDLERVRDKAKREQK